MYADEFLSDLTDLQIQTQAFTFPKATDHIQEQINLIQRLEKKGYTYITSDGVYFDTKKYGSYGTLGGQQFADLQEGARVEAHPEKKNKQDFALWKFSPKDSKRLQEWDSPWGKGFPGWHIECSAMAMKYLGETLDIHTGGIDHIHIHHNNEIAQSEGATGKTFAHIWMHVAFLSIADEKISKSIGNTYTLSDIKEMGYDPSALRYLFLQSHYHTPLSFSFDALLAAQKASRKLREEYRGLPFPWFTKPDEEYTKRIDEAMGDDLNTAKVLAMVWEIYKDASLSPRKKKATIAYADTFLGLLAGTEVHLSIPKEVQQLVDKRERARVQKQFDTADALRKDIHSLGYEVDDTQEGPYVRKSLSKK